MRVLFAAVVLFAIFSTLATLSLGTAAVIADSLGSPKLMPLVFTVLFVGVMYLPERSRHEETVK